MSEYKSTSGRRIITTFIHPPIGNRAYDWQAHFDDEGEEAGNYGYGRSERDSIIDLENKEVEKEPT